MNISGLFNISLRLLLDKNSISRVNGLAGKGLNTVHVTVVVYSKVTEVNTGGNCVSST